MGIFCFNELIPAPQAFQSALRFDRRKNPFLQSSPIFAYDILNVVSVAASCLTALEVVSGLDCSSVLSTFYIWRKIGSLTGFL